MKRTPIGRRLASFVLAIAAVGVCAAEVFAGEVEDRAERLRPLTRRYPTLAAQVEEVLRYVDDPLAFADDLEQLVSYAAHPKQDIALAMSMILQEEIAAERIAASGVPVVIDGNPAEWAGAYRVEDPERDAPSELPSADVEEAAFSIDANGVIRAVIRTAGPAVVGSVVQVAIDCAGDSAADYGVWLYLGLDERWYAGVTAFADGTHLEDTAPTYAVRDDVYEMRIALDDLPLDESPKETITLVAEAFTAGDTESDSVAALAYHREPNFALLILMHLLDARRFAVGDPMAAAIALATNRLYAIGDPATRERVLADAIAQYDFYLETVARQSRLDLGYSLETAPLIPKLFWANRERLLELGSSGVLTEDRYLTFIDSIETYRGFARLAEENGLFVRSRTTTAEHIEAFVGDALLYRADLAIYREWYELGRITGDAWAAVQAEYENSPFEARIAGKLRGPSDQAWPNRVYETYRSEGYFLGDCGTATTAMMTLYRVAGIPVADFQWYNRFDSGAYTHNFPVYYNDATDSWHAVQRPEDTETPLYLHFSKPIWHHRLYPSTSAYQTERGAVRYAYYPGEATTDTQIMRLLNRGIDGEHLASIVVSMETLTPGLLFREATAPSATADADGDGVAGEREAALRTDPALADTDGDGTTDGAEIDRGRDPTRYDTSPAFVDSVSIEGALRVGDGSFGLVTADGFEFAATDRGATLYETQEGFQARVSRWTAAEHLAGTRAPLRLRIAAPQGTTLRSYLLTQADGTVLEGFHQTRSVAGGSEVLLNPPAGRYRLHVEAVERAEDGNGEASWIGDVLFAVVRADASWRAAPVAEGATPTSPYPHLTDAFFAADAVIGLGNVGRVTTTSPSYSIEIRTPSAIPVWGDVFRIAEDGRWDVVEDANRTDTDHDSGVSTLSAQFPAEGRYALGFSFRILGEWLWGGNVLVDYVGQQEAPQ